MSHIAILLGLTIHLAAMTTGLYAQGVPAEQPLLPPDETTEQSPLPPDETAGDPLQQPDMSAEQPLSSPVDLSAGAHAEARLQADLVALQQHRPTYPFWQHIFAIPDGRIIYGSAEDGQLLANFPTRGNWTRSGIWEDPSLSSILEGQRLSSRLSRRRDEVERLFQPVVGPVIHNPTRGRFLSPHAKRYGSFLGEWAEIYERFGVPAEIGLSQAVVESGLDGRARSSARALGLCQWLPRNWAYLKRLSPHVIEGYNQTTQAPYCAAYLTVLATMYGSFIPALSEHHAGGVNVGRTVINGERLGGEGTREQYLLGSDFARELRGVALLRYRQLYRTYGRRSSLYAEMVFGNVFNVQQLMAEMPQSPIYAIRVPRNTSLSEITRKTGLSSNEIKRFNPALVRQVPARATLYLPTYRSEFGRDVSFWHQPMHPEYAEALNDFVRLDATEEEWHQPSFQLTLKNFQERFKATATEEGTVMATILTYVMKDLHGSRRGAILDEFRSSGRIQRLFQRGLRELTSARALKDLQRLVGVEADGICGPRTRAAIRKYDPSLLATSSACQKR